LRGEILRVRRAERTEEKTNTEAESPSARRKHSLGVTTRRATEIFGVE